jgi:hypothetical protein
LEWGFIRLKGAVIVEAVPELMRDGHYLVQRAVKVAHHAAFFEGGDFHTVGSAALPGALLRVNPTLSEGGVGEAFQFR